MEAVEEPQLGKEDGPPAAFLASCSAADDHPEGDGGGRSEAMFVWAENSRVRAQLPWTIPAWKQSRATSDRRNRAQPLVTRKKSHHE